MKLPGDSRTADSSRRVSLSEKLADLTLVQRLRDEEDYRRRFVAAAALSLLAVTLLVVWTGRSLERAEMLRILNEQPAFQGPAMGIMFPRNVSNTPRHRELLAAGERLRYWSVRQEEGGAGRMTVRVTEWGRPMFTPVEGQVLATFSAGSREVTRILSVEGGDQSRRVRFRYRWTELHPAVGILGDAAPESGRQYDGEALFSFENDQWRVIHWSTPFEEATARFRELGTQAR